ncbi:SHUGOSHIN 2 isoform X4 [Arachis ipaensis]|uniref:SHUGOSHIN 2 isoform X4 n=1 Tax=Arachis ipaensis TaxID=130454 RepID=UPI000A2B40BE|nr:SHUGOSHIN 2 isoform X4 [Arachis ipaensis]XP_025673978.1 SHUGOSHIN 2 isoform X4 [Arachis hypogaea]
MMSFFSLFSSLLSQIQSNFVFGFLQFFHSYNIHSHYFEVIIIMAGERSTAKKTIIGSLMRKKLSDITNSSHHLQEQQKPPEDTASSNSADKDCIQQLLKERMTLLKLLAEKNKIIEWTKAEMQMLRGNVQKLQLQNWNLAQSNTHMLGELNLGRERIKALQHELVWRAALFKGTKTNTEVVVEKVEMKNGNLADDGDDEAGKPSPEASYHKQRNMNNRRRSIRRRSTPSPKNPPKTRQKDKGEPLEELFEIEDGSFVVNVTPSRPKQKAKHVTTQTISASRSSSFRIPFLKS